MPLKIAIVGAGPAGCMLARLLQQSDHDISVAIFEGEAELNFRSQGGSLDLHEKTGQAAVKAAGLWDGFVQHARYDGEAMKLCDKKLLCYLNMGGGSAAKGSTVGGSRPEIDRPKLRELLFDSLEPGTVRWSSKLVEVEGGALRFADGRTEAGFDLLVGADGAWSKVRPTVSDVKPFYSGVSGHSLQIADAVTTTPELYELANRGSVFAFSDGKSIMAQQMGDGSLNVASYRELPEDWQATCGYDARDASAVKAELGNVYADWDARLQAFLQKAGDQAVPRDLYMLPIGHRWEHVRGVTLIGDASHLMTPFAGEGVNLALEDSLKLSRAIIAAASSPSPTAQDALDREVLAFETDMFARAKVTQQLTYDMMEAMYFVEGAPRNGIERYILRAMKDEVGWMGTMALTPLVYAWFGAFKLLRK